MVQPRTDRKINPSFSLSARDMEFIDSMRERGRFGSKTEVVRAALRMLEDYENSMEAQRLRNAIAAADTSVANGQASEYDSGSSLARSVISKGEDLLQLNSEN